MAVNWQDRQNPQAGGAEEHLHRTLAPLAERGHGITLLVSGFGGCTPRTRLDGLDIHRAGSRYTFSFAAPVYYRERLAHRSWDVVLDNINKVPLFTPWWTEAPVVSLVNHLFGATAFREANPLLASATWMLERFLPLAYRGVPTIAVSRSTRDDLVARGLDGPMHVIPSGIDCDLYSPGPSDGPLAKTETPSILFLGRLKRYKGVDLLVRAVGRLAERGRPVRLLIAGDGDYRGDLEALARRTGVGDRVRFLGFVGQQQKIDLLRRAWVHALTSPKEGWGLSNLEAAACGTPSVASDSPGLRESVLHGQTGLLTPHGDVPALADAIELLVTDHALRNRLGEGARTYAKTLTWDSSARAVETVLVSASGRREGGPRL
ncbi:MAG: glycosyltransferase family 4 protein [Gemmatimonadetes bacterium]|nr:glycosyltransferase family 4 protein [Gemmatimonadota bacterium]